MDARADDADGGTGRPPGPDAQDPVDDLELAEDEHEEADEEDLELELEEEE
jgi:hypothetical protein